MNLLAIEISSAVGSAALRCGADVRERVIATPREQTAALLPAIHALCAEAGIGLADLDAIAFGRGPGSFTGLRVAAAVTQGLALASSLPVAGVSSLAAIAQRALREHGVEHALVCVDARMGEVYRAEYAIENGLAALRGEERLCRPEEAEPPAARGWVGLGDAFARYADALAGLAAEASAVKPGVAPAARDVLALGAAELAAGRALAPEEALPVYLREASAWRRSP